METQTLANRSRIGRILLGVTLLLAGCAYLNFKPIEIRIDTDYGLSCHELEREIIELNTEIKYLSGLNSGLEAAAKMSYFGATLYGKMPDTLDGDIDPHAGRVHSMEERIAFLHVIFKEKMCVPVLGEIYNPKLERHKKQHKQPWFKKLFK